MDSETGFTRVEDEPTGVLQSIKAWPWTTILSGVALMFFSYLIVSLVSFFVHGMLAIVILAAIMFVGLMILRRFAPDAHAKLSEHATKAQSSAKELYDRHLQPALQGGRTST
mmetsp:Transcript_7660/g.16489  ORF Transcript_7660/g.16489 Transcript_7660/m.16489 type:complete len:112 (-) Transcript_7660:89-424(-)|eukprot:CAMPEP_0204270548 /NCGR_PEP_ID=MMETSP0468-20130131/18960_1 /ASSEMBLY_ACC=CAM_ASM_000383 /TAXON_ID=2969 /ORGANISM="Oxyrrhis marina" /LENGTH=111 /DNA_ID=CAMNT_0051246101 /DNA_START=59 /DNA_END=394 /DNA_ORIENTATION=-